MTKEDFVKAFNLIKTLEKETDKWTELGLNIVETKLLDTVWSMQDLIFTSNFTTEGCDWIFWWLFEKGSTPELKAYDENEKEIPLETIDDLWNFVKDYRK